MALQPDPSQQIDRQTTPPFLLRLYYRNASFHSPQEFSVALPAPTVSDAPPVDYTSLLPAGLRAHSLQIYTWPSCTLAELTALVTGALPDLVPQPAVGTRLGFRLVFADTRSASDAAGRGRWLSKEVGSVVVGGAAGSAVEDGDDAAANGGEGERHKAPARVERLELQGDAEKTLAEARFVIGDYVSCAVFPPLANGDVAPVPPSPTPARAGYSERGGGPPRGGRYDAPPPRENGNGRGGGYRGGYAGRGGYDDRRGGGGLGGAPVPGGEWRRGERIPDRSGYGGGYGRGRGRPY